MAAAIVLNNYLLNVLLINDVQVRNALNIQGLTVPTDFVSLADSNDIKNICANARKASGTIVNPMAANPNQPPTIPNPGVQLGHMIDECWLEMLRYYVFHCTRIQ
jgi:hypothetical protein